MTSLLEFQGGGLVSCHHCSSYWSPKLKFGDFRKVLNFDHISQVAIVYRSEGFHRVERGAKPFTMAKSKKVALNVEKHLKTAGLARKSCGVPQAADYLRVKGD